MDQEKYQSLLDGNFGNNKFKSFFFASLSQYAYGDLVQTAKLWEDLKLTPYYYDIEGAQCYLLEDEERIIVVFRGTEPDKFNDIRADLQFLKTWHRGEGKVHRGFMIEVWKLIEELTKHVYQTDKKVFVCGHSLGGAMATLYAQACRPKNPPTVFTYGAPRAGNRKFAKAYNFKHFRHVNNNDAVPMVPPATLGFKHTGDLIYINHYGNIRKATPWQRFKDKIRGHLAAWKKFQFFDSLRDHGMQNYVNATYKYYKDDQV